MGGTTRWAASHFRTVHTIERDEALYKQYAGELSELPGVVPHLGDCRQVLPHILSTLSTKRAMFWLDGHWAGEHTAGKDDQCPIVDELNCLAERRDDIILIDDARLFLSKPPAP